MSPHPMPDRRNGAVLVASAAAAALALHLAGRGVLAPPAWTISGWRDALEARGPVSTALAAVRLVALGACAYLAVLGALVALFSRTRHRVLRRALRSLTPRLLRPLLGLVTVVTLASPAHAADRASTPPVMVLVTTTTAATPRTTAPVAATSPAPPPTMRRVPGASIASPPSTTAPSTTAPSTTTPSTTAPSTSAPPISTPPTTAASVRAAGGPAPVHAVPATWTVERGDHFWHIAESTRAAQLGRAPTGREIDAYWRALVAANRDRLVDPANPDLLFAGQELTLPPG